MIDVGVAARMKPELELTFDFSLQRGTAIAYDEHGQCLGECHPPRERPPAGTRRLELSIEDFMDAMRALGRGPSVMLSAR